jgi:hypothetical protein
VRQVVELSLDGRRPNLRRYPIGLGDGLHLAVGHPGRLDGRSGGAKVLVALVAEVVLYERNGGSGVH